MRRRNVRRVLVQFRKNTLAKVEHILGYTAPGEDRFPRRKLIGSPISSTISRQWYPASSEPFAARSELSVRNPDLDHTSGFPTEEANEAYASNLEDPDKEIIEIRRANRSFFDGPRPSSLLAADIEEDWDIFSGGGLCISEPLSQGLSSSAGLCPTQYGNRAVYDAEVGSIRFTERVARRSDRHMTYDPLEPGQRTFLQRMTEKLEARASLRNSAAPASRSSAPRSALKSSVGPPQPQTLVHELGLSRPKTLQEMGPSQPKTLVRKQACRNLGASLPIITITPPDTSTHGSSEPVTSHPKLSFTPTHGPSAPAPSSSGAFLTVPRSSVTSARKKSRLSRLQITNSVKYGYAEAPPEARWAIKAADIEPFTKKLEHAKWELRELEAKSREEVVN